MELSRSSMLLIPSVIFPYCGSFVTVIYCFLIFTWVETYTPHFVCNNVHQDQFVSNKIQSQATRLQPLRWPCVVCICPNPSSCICKQLLSLLICSLHRLQYGPLVTVFALGKHLPLESPCLHIYIKISWSVFRGSKNQACNQYLFPLPPSSSLCCKQFSIAKVS